MASSKSSTKDSSAADALSFDPCYPLGKDQWTGVLWFCCVIVFASCLVYFLSSVDGYMYSTGGEFIDYGKVRQNRVASTSMPSDKVDERTAAAVTSLSTINR